MRRTWSLALLPLLLIGIVLSMYIEMHGPLPLSAVALPVQADSSLAPDAYVYMVRKDSTGFTLYRTPKGTDGQPIGTPEKLVALPNRFGLATTDTVSSLQLSPDTHYLAINGEQDHGQLVWIYNTLSRAIGLAPPYVNGNFLHWMPSGHSFLYRPMFPLTPQAPMDGGVWNPGLWIVDAATGGHKNLNIQMPSAFLADASPSPDGKQITFSTTIGLGQGSDVWMMNSDGTGLKHLFKSGKDIDAVDGMFAWSPDGKQIAYERLADSTTPFLLAELWIMNSKGNQQQRLSALADGGQGYQLSWSPDGQQLAFIERTNSGDHLADQVSQADQNGISVVDISSKRLVQLASIQQTGMQLNIHPRWSQDSRSITFTALNPINKVLGGSLRYYKANIPGVLAPHVQIVAPLTAPIPHIIAVS